MEGMQVTVNVTQMDSTEPIKYLEVLLDRSLSFKNHATYARRKAAITLETLPRLMPNIGSPKMPARKLQVVVAKATLLYPTPIWSIGTRSVVRTIASEASKLYPRMQP